eukprot:12260_6
MGYHCFVKLNCSFPTAPSSAATTLGSVVAPSSILNPNLALRRGTEIARALRAFARALKRKCTTRPASGAKAEAPARSAVRQHKRRRITADWMSERNEQVVTQTLHAEDVPHSRIQVRHLVVLHYLSLS